MFQIESLRKQVEEQQQNIASSLVEDSSRLTTVGVQSKLKISQLQEQKRQMDNALEHFEQALATEDPTVVPDSMLSTPLPIDPEARLTYDSPDKPPTVSLTAPDSDDPFKSKDPFAGINGFPTDPFEGEDPFKSVEGNAAFVRSDNPTSASDPFASNDPFADDTFGSSASGKNNWKLVELVDGVCWG
ncbi:hypothetical protein LAZ67_2004886 [Cordylochernes scorpioides]|uniref:Uncharacterized protein n=1 Tax=Cordylochernes scorpioides TaxID=51811 RepID=A0ABY6K5K1_9ARAC|nr:hypothetical protein LAZ67_2004886 [Cordylochernes scorpioides]